eukprot:CAMPEP_0206537342 /NCGR_PEP_ID=MMETSP0325_2-20121206/7264_1 /ASSEMBLY_ACC=CAM_ASM_000347 /TAXON_ID=2866 /ORGANISM="Crypthecodinium cohnii, Strain Seligo" /LENGTH=466 /DNA_ID=CAMNT_0054034679 /DNA_START=265 /DNA_END=1661 /DNA_ORIENTATION=+
MGRPKGNLVKYLILVSLLVLVLMLFVSMRLLIQEEDLDNKFKHAAAPHKKHPHWIPRQLILTSKSGRLEDLPRAVQKNIEHNIALDPDIKLRMLGDAECQAYISQHFGAELSSFFEAEKHGSYRGDICRSCVLAKEGGFYLDLDVQLKFSLLSLIDNHTTFMSVLSEPDLSLLNAVMAAEPQNPIVTQVVEELRKWYRDEVPHTDRETSSEWMGPVTLRRATENVTAWLCGKKVIPLQNRNLQWNCGTQRIRLYEEQRLPCFYGDDDDGDDSDCPPARRFSDFEGLRYGIFEPAHRKSESNPKPKPKLVAWSRFEACQQWGCSAGGSDESNAATSAKQPATAKTTQSLADTEAEGPDFAWISASIAQAGKSHLPRKSGPLSKFLHHHKTHHTHKTVVSDAKPSPLPGPESRSSFVPSQKDDPNTPRPHRKFYVTTGKPKLPTSPPCWTASSSERGGDEDGDFERGG